MRIAILHQDLEWAEEELQRLMNKKGAESILFDIRNVNIDDLRNFDLVLNRVYASVANRNYLDNVKVLELLKKLESEGVRCLNSYETSLCDYSKFFASQKMNEKCVRNPKTVLIKGIEEVDKAKEYAGKLGYPLIVKRDMGGRGKDVYKVDIEEEMILAITNIFSEKLNGGYGGCVILQEFMKSVRDHDCRIAIVNGQYAFSYKRSLICEGKKDEPWMASVSRGSVQGDYIPSQEEIDIALESTNSIGATFNEVDMVFTENGPAIIENNPTPNYIKEDDPPLVEKAVDMILKELTLTVNN
jgi:glutathione synthase/RimK-type ligase-like ATP-grasp enzyme